MTYTKLFRDKQFYQPLFVWLVFLVWYIFFAAPVFTGMRLKTIDFFSSLKYYFSPTPPGAEKVVIVAIDKNSREELNLRWPWKRGVFARLLSKITSSSPAVVGMDLIFSGVSDEPQEDEKLAGALSGPVPVVISYRWTRGEEELPLKIFRDNAYGLGFVNKPKDADDVIRNTRMFIRVHGRQTISLESALAAAFYGVSPQEVTLKDRVLCLDGKVCIPVSKGGITPINYRIRPAEFTTVPAFLVLKNKVPVSYFKNKIVLIGYTDPLMHDEHLTPLGFMPGIVLIGNTLVMILDKEFLYNVGPLPLLFIILAGGISIIGASRRKGFAVFSFLTLLLFVLLFFIFAFLRIRDFQADYFSVYFCLFSSYVVSLVYHYSHLLYYNSKLKNIAVRDASTGLYTRRYFSLRWKQEYRRHYNRGCLIVVEIKNYSSLSRSLNFIQMKNLIKMWTEYFYNFLDKRLGKTMGGRLGLNRFAFAVSEGRKEARKARIRQILDECRKVSFKMEESMADVEMKSVVVCADKSLNDGEVVLYLGERALDEEGRDDIVFLDSFEHVVSKDSESILGEDDFLVNDLEARNRELESMLKDLMVSKKETEEAYFSVILSLVKALEEKDIYTQGHSERVARYARAIAEKVGLSEKEVDNIYKAALLHDIGKIGLPDYLLHKKGELTDEEIAKIRRHEIISVEILKPIKAFEDIFPIILHHHEFFNGEGYPYGLSGDMIPLGAQILAVADSFDAMTSGRGYRKVKTKEEAMAEMEAHKGEQFNPVYVDALRRVLGL